MLGGEYLGQLPLAGRPVYTVKVSATVALTWDTRVSASAVRALKWDTASKLSATRALRWDTSSKLTASRALTWDTIGRSTAVRALVFDVAAPIGKASNTVALRWDTSVRLTAARGLVWDTAVKATAVRALRWDTASKQTATRALTWDTFTRIAQTRALRWDTSAYVAATRGLRWDTSSRQTATRGLRWDTANRIFNTRALRFDVIHVLVVGYQEPPGTVIKVGQARVSQPTPFFGGATVNATRALRWDAIGRVSATASLRFDVSTRQAAAVAVRWDIFVRQTATRALRWDSFVRVSTTRAFRWFKGGVLVVGYDKEPPGVVIKVGGGWRVGQYIPTFGVTRIATTRALRWDTAGRVSSTRSLRFDVGAVLHILVGQTDTGWGPAGDIVRVGRYRVGQELPTAFARSSSTRAFRWDVTGLFRVAHALELDWSTSACIRVGQVDTGWPPSGDTVKVGRYLCGQYLPSVAGRATHTVALKWDVALVHTFATRALRWDITRFRALDPRLRDPLLLTPTVSDQGPLLVPVADRETVIS